MKEIVYTIGRSKLVENLTMDECQQIMDDLYLPNPAYIQALEHSPYARILIPKYLQYFTYYDKSHVLEVPLHYPIEAKCIKDDRVEVSVEYPPSFLLTPRDTQLEAVEAYLGKKNNAERGLFVLPTGKGKTVLAIYLAWKLKQKALIIVHKDDLVDGWRKDIQQSLGLRPKQIGLIKAKEFRIGSQITISTIQTLSKLPRDVFQKLSRTFGMICLDEMHHVGATSYEYAAKFYARYRIGLTATDMRNDGLGEVMYLHFGEACYRFKEKLGEDDPDIISAKNVLIHVEASEIKWNPSDRFYLYGTTTLVDSVTYNDEIYVLNDQIPPEMIAELIREKVITRKPLDYSKIKKLISEHEDFNNQVCDGVEKEYNNNKSILVFCALKDHCRYIHSLLLDRGIPEDKMQLYYGDSTESKESMKKKAESGEVMITIATYAIATEGTNVKRWERIFLTATFNNEKDTIQAVGRARRKSPRKTEIIVYDYSHPYVKGIKSHIQTRMRVYKKMGFTFFHSIVPFLPTKHGQARGTFKKGNILKNST